MHVIGYVCRVLVSCAQMLCLSAMSFPYRQTVIKFCYGADQDWLAKLSWRCLWPCRTPVLCTATPARTKNRCAEFCWPLSLSFRKLCWRKKGRCHCFCRWLPGLVRRKFPRANIYCYNPRPFCARQVRLPHAVRPSLRLDSAPSREAGRCVTGSIDAAALRPCRKDLFMADHCRQPQYNTAFAIWAPGILISATTAGCACTTRQARRRLAGSLPSHPRFARARPGAALAGALS